jgi:hypothetical protein
MAPPELGIKFADATNAIAQTYFGTGMKLKNVWHID